jgi:YidC/Oxa1 family membrane protein insertase
MLRASPSQNQQQQMLMRIMPVFFGFIGYSFPAGLVVYWTTTNAIQIIQQHYMLPKAPQPPPGQTRSRGDGGKASRRGKGAGLDRSSGRPGDKGSMPGRKQDRQPSAGDATEDGGKPRPKEGGERRSSGGGPGGQGNRAGRGPGGRNGGDRKKRRKR